MTLRDLQKAVNKALNNANCSLNVPVCINHRLTRTLGRAVFTSRGGKLLNVYIEFSGNLIKQATERCIMDVLLHECAHVVANTRNGLVNHGHDKVFKAVCAELGTANNKTYTVMEYAKPTVNARKMRKYSVICPRCGVVAGFDRQCKTTQNLGKYRCSKCGCVSLSLKTNF